jgi:Pentapeptide repeats (8 copies)
LPDARSRPARSRLSPVFILLILLTLFTACLQIPAATRPQQGYYGWAFAVSVLADAIKIAEVIVILWGARQLWLGRGERKAAEAAAAELGRKAANYQAWQVVNTAQGKGGSGGRVDALQDLVRNSVSLAGVRLDDAWLEGIRLDGASLPRASLRGTILQGARLRRANLRGADLTGADLTGADLRDAILKGATLAGATLAAAELGGADLSEVRGWEQLGSISYARIDGVRHAPHGWREWMLTRGATEGAEADDAAGEPRSFSQDWRAV